MIHEINVGVYDLEPKEIRAGTSGSYGVERMRFIFGEEWTGLSKTVTFYPVMGKPVSVLLTSEEIDIPHEATAKTGVIRFAVEGSVSGRVIRSFPGRMYVAETVKGSGLPSQTPTPTETEQIKDYAKSAAESAEKTASDMAEIKSDIAAGKIKGDKGDKGEKGEKGDKGDTGATGAAGAQGVSGVYVGSGDMPAGYNVQIDPDGDYPLYAPVEKTSSMTQGVGVDSAGKLWTAPGGGGTTTDVSFADDGSGNISVNGASQTALRYLNSMTFPGLDYKYVNPMNGGTYARPYGFYVTSGSLVDAVVASTQVGFYTAYVNRKVTDIPAEAAAASSSLRGFICVSQLNAGSAKCYAYIVLIDQNSNFYVQYIQGNVGGGWKRMYPYDTAETAIAGKVDKSQGTENAGKPMVVGGDGNVSVGSFPTVDGTLNGNSNNAVQNSAVQPAIANLQTQINETKEDASSAVTMAGNAQSTAATALSTAEDAQTAAGSCVSYMVEQSLGLEQKTRARQNIGAASAEAAALASTSVQYVSGQLLTYAQEKQARYNISAKYNGGGQTLASNITSLNSTATATFDADIYKNIYVEILPKTDSGYIGTTIPIAALETTDKRYQLTDEANYVSFKLKLSAKTGTATLTYSMATKAQSTAKIVSIMAIP